MLPSSLDPRDWSAINAAAERVLHLL